jgi:hypothetical protein
VSEAVRPNVKAGDDIDLRTYVKLKKVRAKLVMRRHMG